MLIKREREKLLNSIIYFAQHTDSCGKVKLIKLLSLLDFGHYCQTGRSVTGMDYYAWRMGPVPVSIEEEFDCPSEDFQEFVTIKAEDMGMPSPMLRVIPRKEFNPQNFSKRELRLLGEISEKFKYTSGTHLVEITHHEDGPWAKIWNNGEGENDLIPYEAAVSNEDEHILEAAQEHKEFVQNYS